MQDLTREAILRMVGLHDAAHLSRQLNAIQLSMEEQGGKLVTYWTEIRKTEKDITLIAGRMDEAETDIAQLQVTAGQISASVSSLQTTVNGHTESIGQLEITANSISGRVTAIEGDYVKEAEISLMVVKDSNGYISNADIKADNIDFTFTRATNFISGGQTVMSIDNGGNLWIAGEYRGGTITQNVTIGANNSDALYKMILYTDEKISSSLPWLSSGLRGVLNDTVYFDIGFSGVGGQSAYPRINLNNGGSGSNFNYATLSHDRINFGVSSSNRLIIGYTGRIYIHGNYSDWYTDAELSSLLKGDVYIDANGFLKVKNY